MCFFVFCFFVVDGGFFLFFFLFCLFVLSPWGQSLGKESISVTGKLIHSPANRVKHCHQQTVGRCNKWSQSLSWENGASRPENSGKRGL